MNESQESWPWDDSPRFILPNGIDPAEYAVDRNKAREQVWQSLPELQKSEYVLFLGRLHPKKRLDVLLEAFLLGAPPEFKLVVAGPDESDLWRALAVRWLQARDVASRVVRVGTVTGRQKVMLFAGARLFALPSEHENFGIAPLEALAAGTPVLLSPQVDLSETVVAAGFGLTAPLTTAAWRERLTNILTDPAWLSAVADKARRWTAEHYSWDRLATQVVEHYHSIRQVGQWSQLAARTASASVSCPR
jgi:glycosyltransferase involved in cell wall biosynthesis